MNLDFTQAKFMEKKCKGCGKGNQLYSKPESEKCVRCEMKEKLSPVKQLKHALDDAIKDSK